MVGSGINQKNVQQPEGSTEDRGEGRREGHRGQSTKQRAHGTAGLSRQQH